MYFSQIRVDPSDDKYVYVLGILLYRSAGGGATFPPAGSRGVHPDQHALWIDPRDPRRMIEGNDGGACVTFNGRKSWCSIFNQPTAEFYHVTTDTQAPYRVYGAQQDNSTITVPSRSRLAAITLNDCYEVGGGESGYIAVRPDNPNIVYSGSYLGYLTRYDHRTGQTRDITVWPEMYQGWPARDAKYRFQWTFPILLSPHDPNVLYATGNHIFRSTDEGSSWEEISPDLTRDDKSKMEPSGGPITKDNVGTEYYGTIFAFAESPRERGLFWAGSDDGLVHISRDAGKTWHNVTPQDLPEWALISMIEPSPHDPATAYFAATRYKLDDFRPYLYKTNDYGQTWTKISDGLADIIFTRVIREDPVRRGLLYAGTETGIHVSFDDGEHWYSLQSNLPVAPIHDLIIKESDLVVATHGRSFWILDDISPLRQLSDEIITANAHLFTPQPFTRFVSSGGFGHPVTKGTNYRYTGGFILAYRQEKKPDDKKVDKYLDAGQNPPDGVIVYYYLQEKPEGEITLTFLDTEGKEIKTFSSEEKKQEQTEGEETGAGSKKKDEKKKELRVPKETGTNRFVWNTRYPDPVKIEGSEDSEYAVEGPFAPPGTYQVRLNAGDETPGASFQILKDPHIEASQEDLQTQFELLMAIRNKISAAHEAINTIRSLRQQVSEWEHRTKGHNAHESVESLSKQIKQQFSTIEAELLQTKAKDPLDVLDFPVTLNAKFMYLFYVVASAYTGPTQQAQHVFADLSTRLDAQLQALHELITTDVAKLNKLLLDLAVPAITPPGQRKDEPDRIHASISNESTSR